MTSICFIADRNIYLKRICNYLVEEGFAVQLICRNNKGLAIEEFDSRIHIYQLKSLRLISKIKEITGIVKVTQPNYVHYQYLIKDLLASLFFPKKTKVIVTPWGSDLNLFSKSLINRVAINIGLLFCDKIQLISEGLKAKLSEQFFFINSNKFIDLSWGVDYNRFHNYSGNDVLYWRKKLTLNANDIILLSYRNHTPIYNHHTLIKSLPKVIERFPQIKCIFTIGSFNPEYLEQSKKLVYELHIETHVIFIEEWIKDELMPSLINLADIVFSIPFIDGLPATLLEIMSTRAVPIISKIEGFDTFFVHEKNGFIMNNSVNSDELADIIQDLIKKYDLIIDNITISNNNYIANNQNWKIQSHNLKNLYK